MPRGSVCSLKPKGKQESVTKGDKVLLNAGDFHASSLRVYEDLKGQLR